MSETAALPTPYAKRFCVIIDEAHSSQSGQQATALADALSQVSWGRADRLWTKKLRQRFSAQRGMNFASYGRRSANAFADQRVILRQLRRLERAADHEMESIQREVEERASRIRIVKPSQPSS